MELIQLKSEEAVELLSETEIRQAPDCRGICGCIPLSTADRRTGWPRPRRNRDERSEIPRGKGTRQRSQIRRAPRPIEV